MIVEKRSVIKDTSSCNFCDKGEINANGTGLIYPYESVYSFERTGSGIRACICKDCLEELFVKVKLIDETK